ncbi:MAG TPA: universal stress protein [Micrococcaceae bacterium]|nr:universal stress protein [Micrococcaceae bacterium]
MTILIGYLPTAEGEAALAAGLEEARRRSEDVLVLNSPRAGRSVDPAAASPDQVEKLLKRAAEAGVQASVRRPEHTDDLTDAFISVSEEVDASLIVIGLRKRSNVGTFIMGSQAQRILLQVDRPVLAVKVAEGW